MSQSREGMRVPQVVFHTRQNGRWVDIDSNDLFRGRTVVLFALPGAFTPTCSSSHLPRYEELADTFRDNGVDEIACLAVNDPYVLEAWGREQGVERLTLLPDGNAEFTAGMDMLVEKSAEGLGERSRRYSMLVRDGVVEKMFAEPDQPGDPFEVSDADTMLRYINDRARAPEPVTVFTRAGCPFCARAKQMLDERGLKYEEIQVSGRITQRTLAAVAGARTVPQVFIGGRHVGGSEDLERYLDAGAST